ncbi:Uncharacterised protein [Klebsiella pneumoniae]|nr:Uncharacterised protein [Klebsiella pneumoniae]
MFELGRLSATAPEETIFHIISNDKGYDGVIGRAMQGGETMLPYIITLLCRETEDGIYGNQ